MVCIAKKRGRYVIDFYDTYGPTVTWNVYAHLMKSTNQEAPSKLEKTIFESNGSKTVAKNKKEVTAKTVTP